MNAIYLLRERYAFDKIIIIITILFTFRIFVKLLISTLTNVIIINYTKDFSNI